MDWSTTIATTVAALLTLAVFSFLYKDNPFYKFAEHLMVGVSAGYWVIILWYTVVIPKMWQPLEAGKWYYIFPILLGILMWARLNRKWSWVSRYPLAFYIGVSTGVAIPLEMKAKIIEQLNGSVDLVTYMHSSQATGMGILNNVLILIGIMAALVYFFFSKAHTGATGGIAKFGIGVLMVGFGASFGFTVMARISLLIERLQFLLFEWLKWG
ncbi:MAG: hypothetical protein HZB43_08470 [candidate division Zixibacteria bacterium]|nr:hypothetical protein [candidate division Zixibacteria bacterium]